MIKNANFQAELQAKIKHGIKPSDLKKKTTNTMPKDQAKYLLELEEEKAELLKQLTNYEQEQKLAVSTFKNQERLINAKEQQLVEKDNLLVSKEEEIEKLKKRIHQLAQAKKEPVS